jgi:hypothetical protein
MEQSILLSRQHFHSSNNKLHHPLTLCSIDSRLANQSMGRDIQYACPSLGERETLHGMDAVEIGHDGQPDKFTLPMLISHLEGLENGVGRFISRRRPDIERGGLPCCSRKLVVRKHFDTSKSPCVKRDHKSINMVLLPPFIWS